MISLPLPLGPYEADQSDIPLGMSASSFGLKSGSRDSTYKKSSTTVDTTHNIQPLPCETHAPEKLTGLVHHCLHWHMSDTLELVVDDQLRHELDETKHVNGLSQGRDDERVPSSVGFV